MTDDDNNYKLRIRDLLLLEKLVKKNRPVSFKELEQAENQVDISSLINSGYLQETNIDSAIRYQVTDYGRQEYDKYVEELSVAIAPLQANLKEVSEQILAPLKEPIALFSANFAINIKPKLKEFTRVAEQISINNKLFSRQLQQNLKPLLENLEQINQSVSFSSDAYKDLCQGLNLPKFNTTDFLKAQGKGWEEPILALGLEQSITIAARESLPIVGACPPEIGVQIAQVTSPQERESTLLQNDSQIISFCSVIAAGSNKSDKLLFSKAIEMYRQKEYIAAQSIVGALIDPLVTRHAELLFQNESDFFKKTEDAKKYISGSEELWNEKNNKYPQRVEERFDNRSVADALVFAIFISTHQFYKFGCSPTPEFFNRHATVHSGDIGHFTRINSLKGIMSVSCALWGFDKPHASRIEENMS